MKYTKFNIALALTVGLCSMGQSFADEISLDKLSAIKPIACTSQSCNATHNRDTLQSCDNCNSLSKAESKNMNQVYSYPYAIYGTNNHVGQNANGVTVSSGLDDRMGTFSNAMSKGVPLADSTTDPNMTGAAAAVPTWGSKIIDYLDGDFHIKASLAGDYDYAIRGARWSIMEERYRRKKLAGKKELELKVAAGEVFPFLLYINCDYEDLPDGRTKVTLDMQNNYSTFNFILGCGELVEVVEPEWLRKKIKGLAKNILSKY